MMHTSDIEALNTSFETATPQDILRWGVQTFGQKLTLVTSFQPTGIVTIHMLSTIAPNLDVLTLDTGLLFPETYAMMDAVEQRFKLTLKRIQPVQSVEQQEAEYGKALWGDNPNLCCNLRKVQPLQLALQPYDAWITGLRRDQSERRESTSVISWDKKHQKVKLCPFATWTEDQVWTYIEAYDLPYNPLHDQHYPSIGCFPCTQQVFDGTDKRAGRWANRDKTECGIHVGNL
jgi:phosphoadenosine phosphosulfate reductase